MAGRRRGSAPPCGFRMTLVTAVPPSDEEEAEGNRKDVEMAVAHVDPRKTPTRNLSFVRGRAPQRQSGSNGQRPSDASMSLSKTTQKRRQNEDDSDSQSMLSTPIAAEGQDVPSQALSQHFEEEAGAASWNAVTSSNAAASSASLEREVSNDVTIVKDDDSAGSDDNVEIVHPPKRKRFREPDSDSDRENTNPQPSTAASALRRSMQAGGVSAAASHSHRSTNSNKGSEHASSHARSTPAASCNREGSAGEGGGHSAADNELHRPTSGIRGPISPPARPTSTAQMEQGNGEGAAGPGREERSQQASRAEAESDVEETGPSTGEHRGFEKLVHQVRTNQTGEKIDARGRHGVPNRLWKQLFIAVQRNTSSTKLDLRECLLDEEGVRLLGKYALEPGCNLKWLDLAWNGIKRKGAILLRDGIWNSKHLVYLDIRDNHVSERGQKWFYKLQDRLKKHQNRKFEVEMDRNEPMKAGRSRSQRAAFSEGEETSSGTSMDEAEPAEREDGESGGSVDIDWRRLDRSQPHRSNAQREDDERQREREARADEPVMDVEEDDRWYWGGPDEGEEGAVQGARARSGGRGGGGGGEADKRRSRDTQRPPGQGGGGTWAQQSLEDHVRREWQQQIDHQRGMTRMEVLNARERNVHARRPLPEVDHRHGGRDRDLPHTNVPHPRKRPAPGGGGGGGGGARGGSSVNGFASAPSMVGIGTLRRPAQAPGHRGVQQEQRGRDMQQGQHGRGADDERQFEMEDVHQPEVEPPPVGTAVASRPEEAPARRGPRLDPVKEHAFPRNIGMPDRDVFRLLTDTRRSEVEQQEEACEIPDLRSGFSSLEATLDSLKRGQTGEWTAGQCEHFFAFVTREIRRCELDPNISGGFRTQVNTVVLKGIDTIHRYNGFLTNELAVSQHCWCHVLCRFSSSALQWLKRFDEWDPGLQLQPGEVGYYRFAHHCDRLMKSVLSLLDRGEVARCVMHVLKEGASAQGPGRRMARSVLQLWAKVIHAVDEPVDDPPAQNTCGLGPGVSRPPRCRSYWQLLAKNLEDVTYRFTSLPCLRNSSADPTNTSGDPPRLCSREEAAELGWSVLWVSTVLSRQQQLTMRGAPWDVVSSLLERCPLTQESEMFSRRLFGDDADMGRRIAFKKLLVTRIDLLQRCWPALSDRTGKPYCADLNLVKELHNGTRKKNLVSELLTVVIRGAQSEYAIPWSSPSEAEMRTVGHQLELDGTEGQQGSRTEGKSLCVMVLRLFHGMLDRLRTEHEHTPDLLQELSKAPKKILSQKFLALIARAPLKHFFGSPPQQVLSPKERSITLARYRTTICILAFMAGQDEDWRTLWGEMDKLVGVPDTADSASAPHAWTEDEMRHDFAMRRAFVVAAENLATKCLLDKKNVKPIAERLQRVLLHAIAEYGDAAPEIATAGTAPVFGRQARTLQPGPQEAMGAAEEADRKKKERQMRRFHGRNFLSALVDSCARMVSTWSRAQAAEGFWADGEALLGLEGLLSPALAQLIRTDELSAEKNRSLSWQVVKLLGEVSKLLVRIDTQLLSRMVHEQAEHQEEEDEELGGFIDVAVLPTHTAAGHLGRFLEALKQCIRMACFEALCSTTQDALIAVFAQLRLVLIRHEIASLDRCEVVERSSTSESLNVKNLLLMTAIVETLRRTDLETHRTVEFRKRVMSTWLSAMMEARALKRNADRDQGCLQLRLADALGQGDGDCLVPAMRGVYRDSADCSEGVDSDGRLAWGGDTDLYHARLKCLRTWAERLRGAAAAAQVDPATLSQIERVARQQRCRMLEQHEGPYMLFVLRAFCALFPVCAGKLYEMQTLSGGVQSNGALDLCSFVLQEPRGGSEQAYVARARKEAVMVALRGIAQVKLDKRVLQVGMGFVRLGLQPVPEEVLTRSAQREFTQRLIATLAELPAGELPAPALRFPFTVAPGMPGLRQVAVMELVKSLRREGETRAAADVLQRLVLEGCEGGSVGRRARRAVGQLRWLGELAAITRAETSSGQAVSAVMALVRTVMLPVDLAEHELLTLEEGESASEVEVLETFLQVQALDASLRICSLISAQSAAFSAVQGLAGKRADAAARLTRQLEAAAMPLSLEGGLETAALVASQDAVPRDLLVEALEYLGRIAAVSVELRLLCECGLDVVAAVIGEDPERETASQNDRFVQLVEGIRRYGEALHAGPSRRG